jgi:hypothetical protein
MSRRTSQDVAGASPLVAENVREAVRKLANECINASAIGAATESVIAIVAALEAMVELADVEGMQEMTLLARSYLRKKNLPTYAPERVQVVREMLRRVEEARAAGKNLYMLVRIVSHPYLTVYGPRVFGMPAPYDERDEDCAWSSAPQHVFPRVERELAKALQDGKDADAIVVGALVGYGIDRPKARKFVEAARG